MRRLASGSSPFPAQALSEAPRSELGHRQRSPSPKGRQTWPSGHSLSLAQHFEPSSHAWLDDPAGGGSVLNTGVHLIDLVRWLGGQAVAEGTHALRIQPGPAPDPDRPAFDPRRGTVYVGAIDMCMIYYYHGENLNHPAVSFGTIAQPSPDPKDAVSGWITAVDGTSGKTLWKYHSVAPVIAGVTVTAGDLVLTGDSHGTLLALDSRDGRELLKLDTGGTMAGGSTLNVGNGAGAA